MSSYRRCAFRWLHRPHGTKPRGQVRGGRLQDRQFAGFTKKGIPENIQLNLYCLGVREIFGELPERATF
ncbi:MAG: hypothetical protein Q7V06_04050, partial [Methanocalculus sp.]